MDKELSCKRRAIDTGDQCGAVDFSQQSVTPLSSYTLLNSTVIVSQSQTQSQSLSTLEVSSNTSTSGSPSSPSSRSQSLLGHLSTRESEASSRTTTFTNLHVSSQVKDNSYIFTCSYCPKKWTFTLDKW